MSPSASPSETGGESRPPRRRPWWRRLLRGVLWTFAGLLLLIGGFLVFLETDLGRRQLARLVEDLGSSPGAEIKIDNLQGSLWSRLSIERVTLSDDEGAWLTVEQATLAWRPSALLDRRAVVEELRAARLVMERLPPADPTVEEEPQPASDPLALPSLPVEVEVQRLALDEIALGAPVLGTPAALSLQAAAGLDSAGAQLDLDLRRLDGVQGAVTAVLAWQPAQDHLALSLKAAEPQGGLAARLLELPELPAIDLAVEGSGPLSAWQGTLDLALDGQPALTAAVTIDGTERRSLALQGQVAPTPLLPAEALPWVAEGATIEARLLLGEESLTIEQFGLASPVVRLAMAGGLDFAAETLDVTARVEVEDPRPLQDLVPELALSGASLSLAAQGPLMAPALTLGAEIADPALPEVALSHLHLALTAEPQGPDAFGADGFETRLSAELRDPVPADPALPPWIWGDLTLTAEAWVQPDPGNLLLRQARLNGQDLDLALDGSLALPDGAADLALALRGKLPPLPETDDRSLGLAVQGQLSGNVITAPAASFTAEVEGAGELSGGVGPLLGASPRLAGAVALGEDGTITLDGVTLEAAQADMSVDGTYGPGGVALSWALSLPDLAAALQPFGQAAAGAMALQGRLEGPSSEDFGVTASLTGRDLAFEEQVIGALRGEIDLQGLPELPLGKVSLSAPESPYGPLRLLAEAQPREDGGIEVQPLTVALGEALTLEGHLRGGPEGLPLTGELRGQIVGGPLWARSFGLPLAGRGTLAVTLTAPEGRQDAALTLALGAGRIADIAHGGLRVTAKGQDLLATPQLDARAEVTALQSPPATLDSIVLTAKGPMERLALTLDTQGQVEDLPNEGRVALSLGATLEQSAEAMTLALSRLQGEAAGLPIALAQPTRLRIAGETMTLAPTTLTVADSRIDLEAQTGGNAKLNLRVEGLELARFSDFLDSATEPSGRIDLAVALAGSGNRPRGTLDLTASNLVVLRDGLAVGPAVDLTAAARLGGGRLDLDSNLSGDFGKDLVLTASLPFLLSLDTFAVSLPENDEIAGRAHWDGDIARLVDFLPLDNQIIRGPLTLDATVAGTLAQPEVSGGLRLERAHYENLLTSTVLSDLTLDIVGQGQQIVIRQAQAGDGGQGRLSLDGNVDLAAPQGLAANINLTMRNFAVARRDDLHAVFDADLAVSERPDGLALTGTLTGDQIDLNINPALPPSVTSLDVTLVRDGVPINPPREPAEASVPFTLYLDLVVDLPRRVFVGGSGLESEWAGHLTITGTADNPVIHGSLSPVRGQFDLVGKTFLLEEGSISFDGGQGANPALDLSAIHHTSDLEAIIHITGRADHPEISLTSRPEMPQDEILARVLFSRGTGRLSPLEAVQLAETAAILSGQTGSDQTVVQRLRNTLGVDVLRIEGGEDGEAVQATLGQYISEGIFVGVTQGSAPGSTAAKVEVDLTDSIILEGTAGADANTSVGVRWQWDY